MLLINVLFSLPTTQKKTTLEDLNIYYDLFWKYA